MRRDRDEFSCPCCGAPTDSSYCAPCDAAECGEQEAKQQTTCRVERTTRLAELRAAHDEKTRRDWFALGVRMTLSELVEFEPERAATLERLLSDFDLSAKARAAR